MSTFELPNRNRLATIQVEAPAAVPPVPGHLAKTRQTLVHAVQHPTSSIASPTEPTVAMPVTGSPSTEQTVSVAPRTARAVAPNEDHTHLLAEMRSNVAASQQRRTTQRAHNEEAGQRVTTPLRASPSWYRQAIDSVFGTVTGGVSLADFRAWITSSTSKRVQPFERRVISPTLAAVASRTSSRMTLRDAQGESSTSASARIAAAADRELEARNRTPGVLLTGRVQVRRVIRSVPPVSADPAQQQLCQRLTLATFKALHEQQMAWRQLSAAGVRPVGPTVRVVVHYETTVDENYRRNLSDAVTQLAPRHPGLRFRFHYEGKTVPVAGHDRVELAASRKVVLQVSQADGRAATRAQIAQITGQLSAHFRRGASVHHPVMPGQALRARVTRIGH